jgi:hypothetical protein
MPLQKFARRSTAPPSPCRSVPSAAPALKSGDHVRVSGKAATVESVTGWREDHITVRWGEPIRSRKNAWRPFIQAHGYPRARECMRICATVHRGSHPNRREFCGLAPHPVALLAMLRCSTGRKVHP